MLQEHITFKCNLFQLISLLHDVTDMLNTLVINSVVGKILKYTQSIKMKTMHYLTKNCTKSYNNRLKHQNLPIILSLRGNLNFICIFCYFTISNTPKQYSAVLDIASMYTYFYSSFIFPSFFFSLRVPPKKLSEEKIYKLHCHPLFYYNIIDSLLVVCALSYDTSSSNNNKQTFSWPYLLPGFQYISIKFN